jgi:phosphoglycerate dehydrogenase-like enzyme
MPAASPVAAPWFPKRILISHTLHEGIGEYIAQRRPDLELRALDGARISGENVAWAEVFVGFRPPAQGNWRELRWIHCIGAGVDAFTFRTGLSPGTLVTRTSEDFGPMIGEYCLARALAVTQKLSRFAVDQAARRWQPTHPESIRGTRALVIGAGAVGRGIASKFVGVGARVDALSRTGKSRDAFGKVYPVTQFETAVAGARWLILACPLTEETFHLLNHQRLAHCQGAYLINVGRGPLVEEAALPGALESGAIAGCALDVFEREPPPPDSPLWSDPRVTISPHISGLTTIPGAGDGFLQCLAEVEAGRVPALTIDRERGY